MLDAVFKGTSFLTDFKIGCFENDVSPNELDSKFIDSLG